MGAKRREGRGHDGSKGGNHRRPQGSCSHGNDSPPAGYPGTNKSPSAKHSRKLWLGRGEGRQGGAQSAGTTGSMFPAVTPWIVLALTWAMRVHYVIQPKNWWVLHPDETFQSLEVAYSELHGYGFRPYEYLPPPGMLRSRLTHVRQRELDLGMFAMRSPLHPLFYVIVSKLARLLGSSTKDYVLWKTAHASVAAFLPVAAYKFCRVVSHSHDAASVAAILSAVSAHLSVLGTHTLVNSLLAPLVFLTLATLLQAARGTGAVGTSESAQDSAGADSGHRVDEKGRQSRGRGSGEARHAGSLSAKGGTAPDHGFSKDYSSGENGSINGMNRNPSLTPKESCTDLPNVKDFEVGCSGNVSTGDTTGEVSRRAEDHECRGSSSRFSSFMNGIICQSLLIFKGGSEDHASTTNTIIQSQQNVNHKDRNENCTKGGKTFDNVADEHVAISASQVKTSSNVSTEKTTKPTGPGHALHSARHSSSRLSSWGGRCQEENNTMNRSTSTLPLYLASFALCLCCYIRVDLCLFVLIVLGPHVLNKESLGRLILPGFVGALFALGVGAGSDFVFYRTPVISPYNWMKFNAFSNISATLFGAMDGDFYLREIFLSSAIFLILSCAALAVFFAVGHRSYSEGLGGEREVLVTVGKLLLSSVILLVFYSIKAHKEVRFLHNVLVLIFVFMAIVLTELAVVLVKSRRTLQCLVLAVLAVFAVSQWHTFPRASDKSNLPWVYAEAHDSGDVNACLDFVSRQPDVSGVFLDKYLHSTGTYSVLGKKVPIIAVIVFEFFEFTWESHVWVKSNKWIVDPGRNLLSLYTFDCPSDFISKLNSPYLLKVLISKPEYNYLVMDVNRGFIEKGYSEVFRVNNMRVLKRKFDPEDEKKLKVIEDNIPLGSNATVLEYEAHWLFRYSLYEKCVDKLKRVLSLEPTRANAYKLLASCLSQLGKDDEALQVLRMCKSKSGRRKCEEKYERIVLHPGYANIGV